MNKEVSSWEIKRAARSESGLSLVELVAILAIIILIVLVASPYLAHRAKASARAQCVNNLKNVGLAFRIYSTDSSDAFAATRMLNAGVRLDSLDAVKVFAAHSSELGEPRLLLCPADKMRKPGRNFAQLEKTNISYFVSLTAEVTLPTGFLLGDRNLQTSGSPILQRQFTLISNTPLGWTTEIHSDEGNLSFSDGSVQRMTSARLSQAVNDQGVVTNILAIP